MRSTSLGQVTVPWVRDSEETRDKSVCEKQGNGITAIGEITGRVEQILSVLLYCSQEKLWAIPGSVRTTTNPLPEELTQIAVKAERDLMGWVCDWKGFNG